MKLKDQFRFVRQNMKKNRTRLFMTILATAMSVTFLIVLASVGFGLHKSIVKETMERRIVTEIEVHGKQEDNGYRQLAEKDIQLFEGINNVKAVTRKKTLAQTPRYEIGKHQIAAETVVAHMPSEIKAGLELSDGKLPEKDNEVLVGYHFTQDLVPKDADPETLYDEQGKVKEESRYKDNLIGKKVTMNVLKIEDDKEVEKSIEVTVVGIRAKPAKEWYYDNSVFVSEGILKQIESYTGTVRGMPVDPNNNTEKSGPEFQIDSYDSVKVYAKDLESVKEISDSLEDDNYGVYSVVNELKDINVLFTIVKAGLIFIGTIAILIASIGIYNTMTMAVTERAPDIGIMKAIGANPGTINKIFLLESSYIGLIGASIGTVVAYAISYLVNFALPLIIKQAFSEMPPEGLMFSYIPPSLPIISFVICYFVTILSGLRPAQRATKVDVLQALRREV